jgi:hypothetical protein
MSFKMMFQKIQRIDTCAATLADARPLFGFAHRDFFEHGRDQHSH